MEVKQKAEELFDKLQSTKVTELESTRLAEKELFSRLDERRQLESTLRGIDGQLQVLERDRLILRMNCKKLLR